MGYSAEETARKHDLILDQSIQLFKERGFTGVSVGEIMKAAGLTHGPFYNHFSSKDELIAESIGTAMHRAASKIEQYSADEEGKQAYLNLYLSDKHRDACGVGCIVAALANDVRSTPAAREPFTKTVKGMVSKLASHFPWKNKKTARGEAIFTTSALVGALILARAVDDEAFSLELLEETKKRLK